ncbi:MAG: TIGR02147 family protein [Oligoflexales bacterium]
MKPILEKPCLFDYSDYVGYLKDFFSYKKHVKPNYSYRQFSKDGNITSPSYLKEIIDKKRKLTMRSVDKVIESLRLSPQEKKYFRILVNYNNSDNAEKEQWHNLLQQNNRISNSFVIGSDNDYTYLSHWIYGFIFCYVGQSSTEISIDQLEKMLIFPIDKIEIKDALELLVNKNLIEKTGSSSYKRVRDFISTQDENKKLAIKMFHKTALKLADLAIDQG